MSSNFDSRSRHLSPPSVMGIRSRLRQGSYGRLFRTLPPWGSDIPDAAVLDRSIKSLAQILTAPEEDLPEEHTVLPAGYTYLGALITHDMTFDSATLRQREIDPDRLHNFRTPALDLDCIYGRGPLDQPYLYQRENFAKFLIGEGLSGLEPDLPRIGTTAVIGDPRNDETILLSQLHLALLRFHNEIVDWLVPTQQSSALSQEPVSDTSVAFRWNLFATAQQLVRWHYQWILIYDFLERILDPEVYQRLLKVVEGHSSSRDPDLRFFRPTNDPYIPLEFSGAAFRFGHSMSRPAYRLNRSLQNSYRDQVLEQTDGLIPIFADRDDPRNRLAMNKPGAFANRGELLDLSGGRKLPIGWQVDWREFFDSDLSYPYQRSMRINSRFAAELNQMPNENGSRLAAEGVPLLPYLDLQKGVVLQLPSGQALAAAMRLPKIYTNEELGIAPEIGCREAPLYFYILKESEIQFRGLRLGRLGSEIVGEVIVGMILFDSGSFASVNPAWKPTLGPRSGEFRMADLLSFTAADFAPERTDDPAADNMAENIKVLKMASQVSAKKSELPSHCRR